MVDLTQPSLPQDFVAAGATPEQAALLSEQHEAMVGRRGPETKAAMIVAANDAPPPPSPPPAVSPATPLQAQEALAAHESAQLATHLGGLYQPPASPLDYRVPLGLGERTDGAIAADGALTQMFFSERMPRDLGEAIMKDLAANRPSARSVEIGAEVRGWIGQMLSRAQADPHMRPYVAGLTADALIGVLSPETIVGLVPFTHYRAGRR